MGAASVQVDKVVNVRMSESQHALLQTYSASLKRNRHTWLVTRFCVDGNLEATSLLPHRALADGRARRQSRSPSQEALRWVFLLLLPSPQACKDGEIDLLFIPRQDLREMVTGECTNILNFNCSSIEAPTQAPWLSFDRQWLRPLTNEPFQSRVRKRRFKHESL